LVATLGSKSNTKKVTRKAILGVNLKKACETIIEPEAPMALRLQSSLLYGVTRVYTQKWDYLLSDTQAIYTSIRTFLSANKSTQIDKTAGKARPNQLVLADDPAFLVDDPLEPPSLEFNDIFHGSSPFNSSQSLLSIRPRSHSNVSKQSNSFLDLDIPSSIHGDENSLRNLYDLPDNDLFGPSSATHQDGRVEKLFNDNEQMLLQNDDLFEIDDYGEIRELPTVEKGVKPPETMFLRSHPGLESTSIASGRVQKEKHDLILGHDQSIPNYNRDGEMRWFDGDTDPSDKNVEPVTAASAIVQQLQKDDSVCNEDSSFLSAEAPQIIKKIKARKNVTITDICTELETADMRKMAVEYCANMTTQLKLKARSKEIMASKKKAFHYIFGVGINGVGEIEGLYRLENPLASFSGQDLQAKILGGSATSSSQKYERKRARSEFDIGSVITKRTRNLESELGRHLIGDKDDVIGYDEFKDAQSNLYENSIEIGREAASALKDHPSSSMMPWNLSASAQSRPGSSLQRHGGRVTPASPLIGRGLSIVPMDLNKLLEDQEDIVMYDAHDDENKIKFDRGTSEDRGDSITGVLPSSLSKTATLSHQHSSHPWQNIQSREKNKDFDIYGPAAGVDTQTVSTSQWVREALDRESCNFFYFLQGKIIDEINNFMVDNGDKGTIDNIPENKLTFAKLIEPEKNSSIVAAQAFYHVLSLVNKNVIRVEQPHTEPLVQQRWQNESKIDNDIYISLVYI
ncbi:hypothetical protein Golomagni_00749, partial [Golovinomyces magnicellulatus]